MSIVRSAPDASGQTESALYPASADVFSTRPAPHPQQMRAAGASAAVGEACGRAAHSAAAGSPCLRDTSRAARACPQQQRTEENVTSCLQTLASDVT